MRPYRHVTIATLVAVLLVPLPDSGSGAVRVEAVVRLAPDATTPSIEGLTLGEPGRPRTAAMTGPLDRASARR
jgi:hypothetical protein